MNYDGVRDWLDKVDALGELTTLENIDWNLGMGAIIFWPSVIKTLRLCAFARNNPNFLSRQERQGKTK